MVGESATRAQRRDMSVENGLDKPNKRREEGYVLPTLRWLAAHEAGLSSKPKFRRYLPGVMRKRWRKARRKASALWKPTEAAMASIERFSADKRRRASSSRRSCTKAPGD